MSETDDFLAHYGVKGMKWGRRKAESTGPSREALRGMNKAARAENRSERKAERAKQNAKILDARDRMPENVDRLHAAKQQYKVEKKQIGRVAAKRTLKKVQEQYLEDLDLAEKATTDEVVQRIISDVGGVLIKEFIGSR